MLNKLQDLVVVIIGGAGLLGKSFCKGLAEQGVTVIIADKDFKQASDLARDINLLGLGRAESYEIDITDKNSISLLIEGLNENYKKIDAVVNSAYPKGPNYGSLLEEVTYEDFCKSTSLHLGGYFLVAQQFGIYFRNQGFGNLINLASIYSFMPPRFEIYDGTKMTTPVEYAAIKAGILQLTRYFAKYYKSSGLRFNCISPGGILDGQDSSFRLQYGLCCNSKGMLDPQDLMGTLLYLLSDGSKYITGQNIVVDDGFTI